MERDHELENCDDNVSEFSLDGYLKQCKVVDVYDGDSIKVVFRHSGMLNKWTIRMAGYDAPELRPRLNTPNRESVIESAKISKEFLKSLVMNEPKQIVYIQCGKMDKYGRLLGTVYINHEDNISVNDLMIQNRMGYEYYGGTKN